MAERAQRVGNRHGNCVIVRLNMKRRWGASELLQESATRHASRLTRHTLALRLDQL